MSSATENISDSSVRTSTEAHLREHLWSNWCRVDRLFAGLLLCEWLGAIILALALAPYTWQGAKSSIHPHVIFAIVIGGAIVSLPVFLAFRSPGWTITRHVISAAQMLMSALLIHIGNGRIEMHFHVFGSLAFIAFYRDWRVLVTATLVVALDHLLRGLFIPQSVYGVTSAPIWRTVEHASWVIFENIFLVAACLRSVREMHGIAHQRALLEHNYRDVEQKVQERTRQLKDAQDELLKSARSAGMAEIATSVLHNVGNVLNSVNVSATVVTETLKKSEVGTLALVGNMMNEHHSDLGTFITQDERGKQVPAFINDLASCLAEEQKSLLTEVTSLAKGIEHIKQIVAAQQSMAKNTNMRTAVKPASVIDTAISMQSSSSDGAIQLVRELQDVPEYMIDQHKVLQILINLLSNARQAMASRPKNERKITVHLAEVAAENGQRIRISVTDTGTGIAPEHLQRIFSHGFTTKKNGHGFGLHSCINAAKEMGGDLAVTSDGLNKGATFTLDLPAIPVQEATSCSQ